MAQDLKRKEHEAVRQAVGIYDFTHQLLEVTGKDAGVFLDKLFVNGFSNAKVGQAKYTTMLNKEGIIEDDVIIFRLSNTCYWISTLYIDKMIAHFDAVKKEEDVAYRNRTPETSMIAVQGPDAHKVLNRLLAEPVDDVKHFYMADNRLGDQEIKVARSGFTGELGYELYIQPNTVEETMKALEEAGKKVGVSVTRMTTDAILTSLPREKGYVLMSDLEGTNPLEVGFDWTVNWKKDFIGKAALEKVKKEGAKRALLGFKTAKADLAIEAGTPVKKEGENIGKVTVFTEGYSVGGGIGYALVDLAKAKKGDTVTIGEVETALTDRIFYDPGDERMKG